jgi:hypothetical protein
MKPKIALPFEVINTAPAETAVSFFATESEQGSGKFVVDAGVPKSHDIVKDEHAEGISEAPAFENPSFMLSIAGIETVNNSSLVLREAGSGNQYKQSSFDTPGVNIEEVYTDSKYFPTHDRIIMATLGSMSQALKADTAALMRALSVSAEKSVDVFKVTYGLAASSTPSKPVYDLDISSLDCLCYEVNVHDARIIGSPRRITRFVQYSLREQQQLPQPDVKERAPDSLEIVREDSTESLDANNNTATNNNNTIALEMLGLDGETGAEAALNSFLSDVASESMLLTFHQALRIEDINEQLLVCFDSRRQRRKPACVAAPPSANGNNETVAVDSSTSPAFVFSNVYFAWDVVKNVERIAASATAARAAKSQNNAILPTSPTAGTAALASGLSTTSSPPPSPMKLPSERF